MDVTNLAKAGIISDANVASQLAFSDTELCGFMAMVDACSL